MGYIASYYNFQVTRPDNSMILYNTRTGSLVFIDNKEQAKKIEAILKEPILNIKDDIFKALHENGFIVSQDVDEIQTVAKNFMLANTSKSSLSITVLPTEFCNFKCPYCFVVEDGEFAKMSVQVYNAIFELISQYVNCSEQNVTVTIGWFGGEPLLCVDEIETFMLRLIALQNEHTNMTLRSKIVTNGYLLDYDTFKRLYSVKVKNFQITLDGDRDNHDKWRMLKSGKATFDTVYRNLLNIKSKCAFSDFSISIRGNFLRSNIESMKLLAERVAGDFKGDERFDLSFRPVVDFTTKKDVQGVDRNDYCEKQEAVAIQGELLQHMSGKENISNRMFSPFPFPINKWCNVSKQTSYIFDPNGLVFACDSILSDKSQAIGKLQANGTIEFNDKAKIWRSSIFQTNKYPKCQTCKMLPVCLGGCTRQRLLQGEGICIWTQEMIMKSLMEYRVNA